MDHQEWVLRLAKSLRENGVDVVFDKWDLKVGQDAHAFMEQMVSNVEIQKVALICDRLYAEKADGRSGGVGTEAQIISPEIYSKQDQTKFVAILAERDNNGEAFLPTYCKSRKYIDMSSAERYGDGFDQVLRWVFGKPLHVKPGIGSIPAYLADEQVRQSDDMRKVREEIKGRLAARKVSEQREESVGRKRARELKQALARQEYGLPAVLVPVISVVEPPEPSMPTLSQEAHTLLGEARLDPYGCLTREIVDGELRVYTHGRVYVGGKGTEEQENWEAAIRELEGLALIKALDEKAGDFGITPHGYRVADLSGFPGS